jgi:hypothetical protein
MAEGRAYHPESGLHYIHVFLEHPGHLEIMASHAAAAERLPWMSVARDSDVQPGDACWDDPGVMFIFWTAIPCALPKGRAKVSIHYTESTDRPEEKVGAHLSLWENFLSSAPDCDLVFGNTPTVLQVLSPRCRRTALCPIGHEPGMLGYPEWGSGKEQDIALYGTYWSRRGWVYPLLSRHFGRRIRMFQAFGPERKRLLDASRITLHVSHSSDESGPTSRLWHVGASSSAAVFEKSDLWPCVPGEHYLEVARMDRERPGPFMAQVEEILGRPDLGEISRRAHEHLSAFTVERVMREFVVPATKELR